MKHFLFPMAVVLWIWLVAIFPMLFVRIPNIDRSLMAIASASRECVK